MYYDFSTLGFGWVESTAVLYNPTSLGGFGLASTWVKHFRVCAFLSCCHWVCHSFYVYVS